MMKNNQTKFSGALDIDLLIKVLLIGDPAEETRNLIRQHFNTFNTNTKETLGVEFYARNLELSKRKIKLQIWDVLKQERFKFLHPNYFQGAWGAVYIFDDNNESSFTNLEEWLPIMRKEVGNELKGFSILMIKSSTKTPRDAMVFFHDGFKIVKSKGMNKYLECNFKTGENVDKAMKELASLIIEDYLNGESPFRYRNNAHYFIHEKLYDKAIECFKKALKLDPNYLIVKEELSKLYQKIDSLI